MTRFLSVLALLAAVWGTATADDKDDATKKPLKDPEATFKKLDTDKNGKLNKEEFRGLAGQLGAGKLKDRPEFLDRMFEKLDTDSDDALTLDEFKKAAGRMDQLASKLKGKGKDLGDVAFKRLDADSDGKISKDEFKKIAEQGQGKLKDRPELLDRIFGKLDSNSDGTLTADEYKQMSKLREKLGKKKEDK